MMESLGFKKLVEEKEKQVSIIFRDSEIETKSLVARGIIAPITQDEIEHEKRLILDAAQDDLL